ncbi:MAG: MBL fold metallo-hydrolase, partial [Methanosarcinales archaeon]|nr:MBL fold metallo-hydrolase [Methanosarcinales archaeon]
TLFPVNHPPIKESAGVLVTEGDKKVIITGDTNANIPQQSLGLMQDADLLIIDAIVPPGIDLVKHMNAAQALELGRQLGAREVVFTHVSHMYPPHAEAVREWPLGKDGMEFIV